jgi:tetratricopeptide (TPR) repeat protein
VTASNNRTAQVWDLRSGAKLGAPLAHQNSVYAARFSPNGETILTASHDGTARLWNASTGQPLTEPLRHILGLPNAVFSQAPHLFHEGVVIQAEFSPDRRWVLTASEDHTAQVWDAESGELLMPPLRHEGSVVVARFSPDGRQIVTAGRDGVAKLWTMEASSLPSEESAALARLVSARKVDATEGLVRITTAEFRELWERTRDRYGRYLEVSPEEAAAWHRRELQRCEAAGLSEAAVHHSERVLAVYPEDVDLRVQRAAHLSLLGRYREAAEELLRVAARGPESYSIRWAYALCLLAAGDREGFVRERERLSPLAAGLEGAWGENAAAWQFAFRPQSEAAEMERSVRSIRAVHESRPRNHNYCNTFGAVLFRAGRTAEAIEVLHRSMSLAAAGEIVWDWAFLALALHQQGEVDEARRYRDLLIGSEEVRGLKSPGIRLFARGTTLGWRERIEMREFLAEIEATFAVK